MSRKVYLLGVGLALVALGLAVTDAALGPHPGVTEVNARRVRVGMSLLQTEAIFGEPPGLSAKSRPEPGPPDLCVWLGKTGMAYVYLRLTGPATVQVDKVRWHPKQATQSPLARLRAWLGW